MISYDFLLFLMLSDGFLSQLMFAKPLALLEGSERLRPIRRPMAQPGCGACLDPMGLSNLPRPG